MIKYSNLEISILHTYAGDVDLFSPCENLAFEDIFKERSNQIIFRIIKDNHARKAKTDLHLLRDGLFKAGYYKADISLILQNFKSSDSTIKSNIKAHMELVFNMYSLRVMQPVIKSAYDELFTNNGDIEENVNKLKDIFNTIDSIKNNLTAEKSITDIFDETFEEFKKAQANDKEIIGYETGLKDLDYITCGLKREVIVVGAAPGMGKSTFLVNTAINVAVKANNPTMIFSIEMPASQLMRNMWANYFEINSRAIRGGSLLEQDELNIKGFRNKLNSNLMIDDTSGITAQYIEAKIRLARRTIPLETTIVVIIDYLQRMNNIKEEYFGLNEERQISLRCKKLAELAKVYNLCMIELSQLSRDCIKAKRRATPSDLLGGGGIEQAADQIWMLFRPDYHEKDPLDYDGTDLKGLCEIDVVKNRYGETKAVYVEFDGKYARFRNRNSNEGLSTGNDKEEF